MFQYQVHSTRPVTTAHLAQTMTLLSLTADELRQQIEAELASNPALEMVEERRCPMCRRLLPPGRGACPVCSQPQVQAVEEPVVFISPREDFSGAGGMASDDLPEDNTSTVIEELPTFVMRQIAPELAAEDRRLAAYLLTHLDEDGLLTVSLLEVARYLHLPLSRVEAVQRIIQRAEPVGVGSSNPQQALLVQIEVLSETGGGVPPYAAEIVRDGMDLLSRRQHSELAHKLQVSLRQVQAAVRFISENLNPYPARSHWGDAYTPGPSGPQVYHQPDILISYMKDEHNDRLVVEIIMPLYGTLRVNPLFRQVISEADAETRENWRADLERASLFVKCIQQRNHTMQRLMQRVVQLQRDFVLRGEKYLRPVTRVQLSRELEVHESTISRAVSSKAVQLPNGRIVPLSTFFDRNLNVRTILREMIAGEKRPLSDTELSVMLQERGIDVARRTVAKYRSMEGILPAHLRHTAV